MDIKSQRKRKLVRIVAACLLIFAFADVLFPSPSCCGGVDGLEGYSISLASDEAQDSNQTDTFDKSDETPRDQHSDCSTCSDNCFCCGHAMVNTAIAAASAPDQQLALPSPPIHNVPTPSLRGTFHPPRLA
jgi:hypothetical protein